MMVDIPIKIIGAQVSVTTANTVANANLVRAYAAGVTLVTIRDADTNVIGTMTMPAGMTEVLVKNYSDTIGANVALLCTPLAWR
jgi:hypothetical protein